MAQSISNILRIVHKTEKPKSPAERIGLKLLNTIEDQINDHDIDAAARFVRPYLTAFHQKIEQLDIPDSEATQDIGFIFNSASNDHKFPELTKSVKKWLDFQTTSLRQLDTENKSQRKRIAFHEMALQVFNSKLKDFEFALIVAMETINGHFKISESKQKQLIHFLDETMHSYGGLLIILGYWEPDDDDDRRHIQKMRMLSSIYSVDYTRGYRLNQEGKKITIEA